MSLLKALQNSTTTENGMAAYHSTNSAIVDLFGKLGSARNYSSTQLITLFDHALLENEELSLRVLAYLRDVRGGMGERKTFRELVKYVATIKEVKSFDKFIKLIPVIGRWDDVLSLFDTKYERNALSLISHALNNNDSLCAKWMPRRNTKNNISAAKIAKYMKLTPYAYRKLLAKLSNTVEQNICSNNFSEIEYSHVPSIAQKMHSRTFAKHDQKRYQDYKDTLAAGKSKINANAIFPYDVIRNRDREIANAQWKALPNYLVGDTSNILPIIDVSGSMGITISKNLTAMDVAISLGVYVSQRINGEFKDHYITFSNYPTLQRFDSSKDILDVVDYVRRSEWGMTTNLEAVFKLILNKAVKANIAKENMPETIIIFSDMQFNECANNNSSDVMEMIEALYHKHNYDVPKLVFWNLAASNSSMPITIDNDGTVLVSGFSPALMKSVLSCKSFNPMQLVLDLVMIDRYNYRDL